jgi:hypothetical protein
MAKMSGITIFSLFCFCIQGEDVEIITDFKKQFYPCSYFEPRFVGFKAGKPNAA